MKRDVIGSVRLEKKFAHKFCSHNVSAVRKLRVSRDPYIFRHAGCASDSQNSCRREILIHHPWFVRTLIVMIMVIAFDSTLI
jgi:hypothetical protein